jgi:hypothetical protein
MARLFLAVLGEPDSRLLLDVLERADWDFSLGVRHGSDPRTVAVLEVLMASLVRTCVQPAALMRLITSADDTESRYNL